VFIDFEKALDSVSRNKIWKIMERFGSSLKILKLIQETRNLSNYARRETHRVYRYQIWSAVGMCALPKCFLLVIDEVLSKSIEGKKSGIIWRRNEQLEDLVFADDVCLLSHRLTDMQEKIKDVENIGKKVRLK
jgi:hypothetical protein